MAVWIYRALDSKGKSLQGVLEADSERHARTVLRERHLKPLQVAASAADAEVPGARGWFRRGRKLDSRSLQLLTRQLASLVASGLPVDEALTLAAKQQRKPAISTLLLDVRSRVVEGRSLAQALAAHPRAFDNMFQSMVKAGESSGFLGAVLNRLADYCESSQHTRQKVQMALVYPLALLGVSMLVVALLMVFVVPRLVGIFSQAGRELPLLTRMLIAVSEFFSSGMALVATAVLLIVVLLCRQWLQQEDKRLRWHSLLLRMPLFGALITESECARFSATLSILLGSGVPLLEALHIATRVLDNRVLRQAAGKVTVAVREGSSLGAALEKGRVFPPLMVHMVASGEANGSLGEQLDHVARHQEKELELLLGTTVALLEPLTILFMGGLVTLIMLAILLPIFDINKFV